VYQKNIYSELSAGVCASHEQCGVGRPQFWHRGHCAESGTHGKFKIQAGDSGHRQLNMQHYAKQRDVFSKPPTKLACDITQDDRPFGGIVTLLAGKFRQIRLPSADRRCGTVVVSFVAADIRPEAAAKHACRELCTCRL